MQRWWVSLERKAVHVLYNLEEQLIKEWKPKWEIEMKKILSKAGGMYSFMCQIKTQTKLEYSLIWKNKPPTILPSPLGLDNWNAKQLINLYTLLVKKKKKIFSSLSH